MNTMQRARRFVLDYGWNSTAYQILNPGIRHWFSAAAPGVVGFVTRGRTWVVAGAPVCAPEALGAVTRELEREASSQQRRVCYVAAASRLEEHFRGSSRHARVALAAQPVWNPQEWSGVLKRRASLRGQLSRARNKGVRVSVRDAAGARHDAQLGGCLDDWLRSRALPPLHFLVEPTTFAGELSDRVLLVAEREGVAVAFLLASPIPQREGFLVEQIVRASAAPNGTAELLIDGLMSHLAARGCRYLTMGLVPLAQHAEEWIKENPPWLRMMMRWTRAHGQRFFHFEGLEQFRAKMCPSYWEPIYAISNEKKFTPESLIATLSAFANGPMPLFFAQVLAKTVGSAARRLGGLGWRLAAEAWE